MNVKKIMMVGVVFALFVIAVFGYLFFKEKSPESAGELEEEFNATTEVSSLGESTTTNPLNNKPDINPVDKSNPFRSIKTNPFE